MHLAATRSGLDGLSAQFHAYLRSQPAHPSSPRPVNLNVWEAVYFRSDRAGLGDWQVDEHVWPGGLHRLAQYVRGRGMQFGLWIEPEMVNPDSELYRAHPDWILAAGRRRPPLQRHQLALDLTRPEVSGYLLERISALISEYKITYVKWDCNRDIIDAGSGIRAGAPAAHHQALAVYALLDELRRRHPDVAGVRRPRRPDLTDARITGIEVSGAALAEIGLTIPAQHTLTALVILIEAI